MQEFLLCFIPLFVAMDAIGTLPVYLGLTEGLGRKVQRRVVWHSVLTALVVSLVFLVAGEALLKLLNVTDADFMIAGGSLLFAISLGELLSGEARQRLAESETLGVVPLGVPLIIGPAVLTTLLLLAQQYGRTLTALAAVANIMLLWGAFLGGQAIDRVLGRAGMRAISKIASLLLAAIAVRMIRQGVMVFLRM